jgi:FlaA1/EpsC-like NDP-sugar epimerase
VFVLDMGEPVRIVDLVRNYAAQIHLDEDDIIIHYTGLRPGEKLSEALFGEHEPRARTAHPKIWSTVAPRVEREDFRWQLEELLAAAAGNRSKEVRQELFRLVPGYLPQQPNGRSAAALAAPYPDGF